MLELVDHNGKPARQHRIRTNGIEMHAVTAGEGEPLLLIHGTPKTHIYWRKIMPLLTPRFQVIAPDVRGAGLTDHPYAENGYLSSVVAKDLVGVLDGLGVDRVFVHGEDRGAEYGLVLAGLHPERVRALSFGEMMLSGFGLEERSFLNDKNVDEAKERKGVWEWHVPFFFKPDVPEMLIAGKEREFWTYWLNLQCYDPTSLPSDMLDEWISLLSTPHGLRGTLDTYKATLANARINRELSPRFPRMPVMTIGASHFFSGLVADSIRSFGVESAENHVMEACGHSLALERPDGLADLLDRFFRV